MANTGKQVNTLLTDAILTRSLILLLLLGSVAGLFAGTALLLRPNWMLRVSKLANGWVSTRQLSRPLLRSINLDSWFYSYNRLFGALLMSGSIYLVYFFTTVFDKDATLNTVFTTATIPPSLMAGLIDALVLSFLTGAVFAMLVSLFLILRPSMLREFELFANQHNSVRQALKPLEIQRHSLDQYVFQHRRWVGWLVWISSAYTVVVLLSHWKNI